LKILIATDKFKDSLTAQKVGEALASGIKRFDSSVEIVHQQMADGGEGTLEVIAATLNLEKIEVFVNDPIFRPIKAYYLRDKDIAFIEMAEASGLQRLHKEEYNPQKTTTYGTGELIKHAIESGAKQINLFVGGSATNDGGIGIASALGAVFMTEEGEVLRPIGEDLSQIKTIDCKQVNQLIAGVKCCVYTDVKNVLFGPNGAAHVYGSQKGATVQQTVELDVGLKHLARILGNGLEHRPGAGAAGGLGYGAMTFLGAALLSGVDYLIGILGLDEKLKNVDLIISGEGKIDEQTLEGKVVHGILKLGKRHKIPVVLVCGLSVITTSAAVYDVVDEAINLEDSISNAATYLELIGERIVRDFQQPRTI